MVQILIVIIVQGVVLIEHVMIVLQIAVKIIWVIIESLEDMRIVLQMKSMHALKKY